MALMTGEKRGMWTIRHGNSWRPRRSLPIKRIINEQILVYKSKSLMFMRLRKVPSYAWEK